MNCFSRGKAAAAAVLMSYAMMLSAVAQAQDGSAAEPVDFDAIEKQMEELEAKKRELLNNKAAAIAAREKKLEEERKAFEEQKAREEQERRAREEQASKIKAAMGAGAQAIEESGSAAPT